MSTRIMSDGKPYTRTDVREARPYHKPLLHTFGDNKCVSCGRFAFWVNTGPTEDGEGVYGYWRHEPGTFWER